MSAAAPSQFPPDDGREVAFAGRSNAGKSSALNAISDNRNLARTSKTPGRTQLINFFSLDEQRYLVDLPGYGFAKVPEAVKRQWQQLLEQYLSGRRSLRGVIVLMDIRHPLTPYDLQMVEWCRASAVACHILLTKADKLKRGAAKSTLLKVRQALKEEYPEATVQLFSATKKEGLEQALERLDGWFGYTEAE